MGYNSIADNTALRIWRYLHSFSHCWLSKSRDHAKFGQKIRRYSSSRSSKVIDIDVNRKRICDFLL